MNKNVMNITLPNLSSLKYLQTHMLKIIYLLQVLKLNSKTTSVPVVNCCCRCSSIRQFGVMLYDYTLCCGLPKRSLYLISCVCGHKQAKLLSGCGLKHVNLGKLSGDHSDRSSGSFRYFLLVFCKININFVADQMKSSGSLWQQAVTEEVVCIFCTL